MGGAPGFSNMPPPPLAGGFSRPQGPGVLNPGMLPTPSVPHELGGHKRRMYEEQQQGGMETGQGGGMEGGKRQRTIGEGAAAGAAAAGEGGVAGTGGQFEFDPELGYRIRGDGYQVGEGTKGQEVIKKGEKYKKGQRDKGIRDKDLL